MQAQTHAPAVCGDGRTSGATSPWQRSAASAGKWAERPCEDERTQAARGREGKVRRAKGHSGATIRRRERQGQHGDRRRHRGIRAGKRAGRSRQAGNSLSARHVRERVFPRGARAYGVLHLGRKPRLRANAACVPQHLRLVVVDRGPRRRRARPCGRRAARASGGNGRVARAHGAASRREHLLARSAHRRRAREAREVRRVASGCPPKTPSRFPPSRGFASASTAS